MSYGSKKGLHFTSWIEECRNIRDSSHPRFPSGRSQSLAQFCSGLTVTRDTQCPVVLQITLTTPFYHRYHVIRFPKLRAGKINKTIQLDEIQWTLRRTMLFEVRDGASFIYYPSFLDIRFLGKTHSKNIVPLRRTLKHPSVLIGSQLLYVIFFTF